MKTTVLALVSAILILHSAAASAGARRAQVPVGQAGARPALAAPGGTLLVPGRLIMKVRGFAVLAPAAGRTGERGIDGVLGRFGARLEGRMFPGHAGPQEQGGVDLTRFFEIRYAAPYDPYALARELARRPEVEYAEPWLMYELDDADACRPNDPGRASQWALNRIQADSAWCFSAGDTSVVIGIIDTGVQEDHPDLASRIWVNPGESGPDGLGGDKSTNGLDDDGNGKVDDWRGWDFGGADYNAPVPDNAPVPTASNNAHGTHVAGIAAAATNNGTGISGVGYSCRILPVKATSDNDTRGSGGTPFVVFGFQAIVYAADMGADVINCSWGGQGGSQFEQDMITYATSHGALVVAAAGNRSTTQPEYPASYDGVLSVAATSDIDTKTFYSNYGPTVDVSAPGGLPSGNINREIYSTYYPSTYALSSGTSMASPHAAGVAALVRAAFPAYTALQAGEQVRIGTDNIDASNPTYVNLLGKGRINALKALTVSSPSVRAGGVIVRDSAGGNNNGYPEPNEDITLSATFTNYLQGTSPGTTATLSTSDAYVSVTNGSFPLGSLATLESRSNASAPFAMHVSALAPQGHMARLLLTISDGGYSDVQTVQLLLNPTFATQGVNNVQVTLTNRGNVGFNDFPANTQGVGFVFRGLNHLFEGGLIIGTSSATVVDVVRNPTDQDADFTSTELYTLVTPGSISQQDGRTSFTDGAAAANRVGVRVDMRSYEFTSTGDSNYVLLQYDIVNTSGASLSNLYAGLFFDWDIQDFSRNKAEYDAAHDLAYARDTVDVSPVFCGARALEGASGYRGLVNTSTIDLTRSAKWSWLSGGIVTAAARGDIHSAISSGPYAVPAGGMKRVAFAILAGSSLAGLQGSADAALSKWNQIKTILDVPAPGRAVPATYALRPNYPNPFNPVTIIEYDLPAASAVSLRIFDLAGREVRRLVESRQPAGTYRAVFDAAGCASGVYLCRLQANRFVETRKIVLAR